MFVNVLKSPPVVYTIKSRFSKLALLGSSFTCYTLLTRINWPPGNKLIENQRKCPVTSCLKRLTYWWSNVVKLSEETTNTTKVLQTNSHLCLYRTGWPQTWKTWKTWKTQGVWKIVKISGKRREIWIFIGKPWKTQGKCRICGRIGEENVFQRIILFGITQGKVWKWPGNLIENSGNLVTQKCGHPVEMKWK